MNVSIKSDVSCLLTQIEEKQICSSDPLGS